MPDILLGIIIGAIGSFVIWLIIRLITPNIKFSKQISKVHSKDPKYSFDYRIKCRNKGYRGIFDLRIYAKYSVEGLDKINNNIEVSYLKTSFNGEIPLIKSHLKSGTDPLIRIFPKNLNYSDEFERLIYPENIRNKSKDGFLTLEDLLGIGNSSYIEIIVIGYDGFSGSPKVNTSKKYKKEDIVERRFKKNSLEINNLIPQTE